MNLLAYGRMAHTLLYLMVACDSVAKVKITPWWIRSMQEKCLTPLYSRELLAYFYLQLTSLIVFDFAFLNSIFDSKFEFVYIDFLTPY